MTATFNEILEATCRKRVSHLCVGLDPDGSKFTDEIRLQVQKTGAGADREGSIESEELSTSWMVAESVLAHVAAFKPNMAFFEAAGDPHGAALLAQRIAAADPAIIRLCDAKRGDIGNTSGRYADAVFSIMDYNAVTVNPLMGWDAVEPFCRKAQNGVFLLCLTSNPGADDFLLPGELYLKIADKAQNQWNGKNNVGLVVGATRPELAARVREVAPDLPFLIPGIGAQGGSLNETLDAIRACENRRFLINASRTVMYPPPDESKTSWLARVNAAAGALNSEINSALGISS